MEDANGHEKETEHDSNYGSNGLSESTTDSGNTRTKRVTAAVQMYWSSATPSLQVKKETQSMRWLLEKKRIYFEEYDVHFDQMRLMDMKSRSGFTTLPQLFISGRFIDGMEELEDLEEDGELDIILDALFPPKPGPAKTTSARTTKQKGDDDNDSSSGSHTPNNKEPDHLSDISDMSDHDTDSLEHYSDNENGATAGDDVLSTGRTNTTEKFSDDDLSD
eukprot:TRINITY_DN304_c0_g1_i1.p1 TRINITY_DN304_c0_g1~~TRINITY_DN304_c0_g1_i1.p1  ORF type:complete len:219 (-),score=53.57 TRINITY_DN304_c0_g1_i1:37-693(-)